MNDAVKNALRLAKKIKRPMRLHQTLARTGYATKGEVEGDVQFAPEDEQQDIAWAQPKKQEPVLPPDETSQRQFYDEQLTPESHRASPLLEQYADRFAEEGMKANEIHPSKDASEFVQQVLNKNEPQLPQYDREAKEAMQNAAIEGLHYGSYFTPLSPVVGAYDFYQGLKSGNPYEAGMASLGLPGRLPKAAAAAASVMMPNEAQASPIKDAMKIINKLSKTGVKNLTQLPNLRNLPVKEGSKIAQKNLHLIPSAESSEGYFVGGPRNVKNLKDLKNIRKGFDKFVEKDVRGGDWYDRYRAGLSEITGNEPQSLAFAPKMQGQWSAGVSPEGELGFTVRELNAALAGNPVKSARPAQHKAYMDALATNDPNKLQLGKKTGQYAKKISPIQETPSATSVTDFRHAGNLGYTEKSGEPQKNALTAAQHTFADYETAAAVGRANRKKLAGRSDWTGEQIQAAPWVRQKAEALVKQRPAYTKNAVKDLTTKYLGEGLSQEEATARALRESPALAYERAFKDANATIADYLPKHTFNATSEQVPGAITRHLPGATTAPEAERQAYSNEATWALAPGGRSGIYGGLSNYTPEGVKTGPGMYVRPTIKSQGRFIPEGATVPEYNPGEVDRPIIGFKSGKVKSIPPEDRSILEAGEATRAYIDAQEAGAGHINFAKGAPGLSNSFTIPLDRKSTPEEIEKVIQAVKPYGYGDVADTGAGLTVTRFGENVPKLSNKQYKEMMGVLDKVKPEGAGMPTRVATDSVYESFKDAWDKAEGSGQVTKELLDHFKNPQLRESFNRNPYIAQKALANMARDDRWQHNWGVTRKDIQLARQVIVDAQKKGIGWLDALEKALKEGKALPAVALPLLSPALLTGGSSSDEGPQT